MLVRTEAGSRPLSGHRPATASANRAARAWSSARPSTIWLSATRPGAARTPAWRMPPPRRLRSSRPRVTTSVDPASSEPTGAHRPLERQHITVVAGAAQAETGIPVATSALKRRAPSRWTGRSPAAAITAPNRSIDQGAPEAAMWVFSRQTSETAGWWYADAARAHVTASGAIIPSASSTVWNCTPALRAAAPYS